MMAPWLILAIGVVYLAVAADLFYTGKQGLSVAFIGYAIGNLGLYWAAK
jgi:hypothetical protein